MKRCKHELVSIQEVGRAFTAHEREADGTWSHDSYLGEYTGEIIVKCHACNMLASFYRARPKWLTERMAEYREDQLKR